MTTSSFLKLSRKLPLVVFRNTFIVTCAQSVNETSILFGLIFLSTLFNFLIIFLIALDLTVFAGETFKFNRCFM